MPTKNKLLTQEATCIWITKDVEKLHEFYHEDCIHHQQQKQEDHLIIGIDNWIKYIKEFLVKYPDYQEKIMFQIEEDNKVVSMIECSAYNIAWSGVVIDRIDNNKIKETWVWFKRSHSSASDSFA